MHVLLRILLVTASTILSLCHILWIPAMAASPPELPLEITIIVPQAGGTVGVPLTWCVTLTPRASADIRNLELQSGDSQIWAWPVDVQPLVSLTNTLVLNIPAIPLIDGDLTPVLEARYISGQAVQTQLISAATPIHVASIETQVEAGVITVRGTAQESVPLAVEFWLHNHSPITLTQVQVRGVGVDLTWPELITVTDIVPGQNFHQTLTPTVIGQHPQPQLILDYTWTDLTNTTHHHTAFVNGETIPLVENWFSGIPNELFSLVFGVLLGAAVSLVPKTISHFYQKHVNRQHLRMLLIFLISQAEQAAAKSTPVAIERLETIFKEQSVLIAEGGLTQLLCDLWQVAERHNGGLDRPGGAQRSEELIQVTKKLRQKLAGLPVEKEMAVWTVQNMKPDRG